MLHFVSKDDHDNRGRPRLLPGSAVLSVPGGSMGRMVTVEDVRRLALTLPRAYEALVRDRVKFRVGRIVFLAFSRDETIMGFGFPKEERAALVAAEPEKFLMPGTSDLRYNWVSARMAELDEDEMHELVVEAWRMCVPKFLRDHPSTLR
jgi:hypothetical protein